MNKNIAVLGLSFGDEGKGVVTQHLCSIYPDSMVTRYSGGSQAAHTAIYNDYKHIFSSFGCGTLLGKNTHLQAGYVINPIQLIKEYDLLISNGFKPVITADPNCIILTPFDMYKNQLCDVQNGTCGVGVGPTIERNEKLYTLTYRDTFYDFVFKSRMELIHDYYTNLVLDVMPMNDEFYEAINRMHDICQMTSEPEMFKYNIYEGSQGLMLDQSLGFFPHVTRSRVDLTNIPKNIYMNEIYLVTRAYSTRHGNGPFIEHDLKLINNEHEINVNNEFQGKFRIGYLNLDLLNYVIEKSPDIVNSYHKHLVITCADQLTEFKCILNNTIHEFPDIKSYLNFVFENINDGYIFSCLINWSAEGKFTNLKDL